MDRLWQLAEVVEHGPGELRLRIAPASACARCAAGRGCGVGVLSHLFGRRTLDLPMPAGARFQPGDRVRVGVRADSLMRAAVMLYGFPLLVFVAGAALGQQLAAGALAGDLAALMIGLAGGGAVYAFLAARRPGVYLDPVVEPLACASGLESGAG